jgi:hypothetical protein
MNAAVMLRRGFETLFRQFAGPVSIFRAYGKPEQTCKEFFAMKNSEKHRPSEVMFQFLEQLDISPGDVIQQQGSRDLWAVSETEDSVEAGVLICFEV